MKIKALVNAGMNVGSLTVGHEYEVDDAVGSDLVRVGFAVAVLPAPVVVPPVVPVVDPPAPVVTTAPKKARTRKAVTDANQ